MEDILLDNDGNFVIAADGDVATVSGMECLVQDIKHRLMTFPGDLWLHLKYGSKIPLYIQSENTEINRLELAQEIRLALQQEEKIDPESIKVEITGWTRETLTVNAIVKATDNYNKDDTTSDTTAQAAIVIKISQGSIEVTGL